MEVNETKIALLFSLLVVVPVLLYLYLSSSPSMSYISPSFWSPAYEWQGRRKPLHPVSVEVDEKRLQVYDRSGAAQRCLNLANQEQLDILLSNNRNHKALLLKVSKEYDLVSRGK